MILAAGRGTRLASLGLDVPKPLVDVGGKPLLARQLAFLERQGVTRVVINAHHRAEAIASFARGYRGALEVVVVIENELLGTAGGVRNALDHLHETPFIVLYGDVLVSHKLTGMTKLHSAVQADATLAVYEADEVEGKGTVTVDERGLVTGFVEKGQARRVTPALINAGIYVLDRAFAAAIPSGVASDFGHDVFPAALERGASIAAYRLPGDVIDVGTPMGLELARAEAARSSWENA